jgi:hypothetical protein
MYTIVLDVTARITKHFHSAIRYLEIIRCSVPVTIRRRPDHCLDSGGTDKLPSPLKALLARNFRQPTSPPLSARTSFEIRMLQSTKIRNPRMDGTAPSSPSNRRITPFARTPRHVRQKFTSDHCVSEVFEDLGSTHINRRGELASDSDDGSVLATPQAVDIWLSPQKQSARRRLSYARGSRFGPAQNGNDAAHHSPTRSPRRKRKNDTTTTDSDPPALLPGRQRAPPTRVIAVSQASTSTYESILAPMPMRKRSDNPAALQPPAFGDRARQSAQGSAASDHESL